MNKILQVKLSESDKEALSRLTRKRNASIGTRAFFILLNGEGKTAPKIAKQTGYSAQTVRVWIKKYQSEGINGLFHKSPPGRSALKSNAVKRVLNDRLESTPSEYGYEDGHWTTALLVDYFSRQSLLVSRKTVERALHAEGWRYKRLSKVPPKERPNKAFKKKTE